MRAALATLGIFIGTTTVIWLVAMGEGVSYQAQQQIKDLGATNIIVRSVHRKTGNETTDNSKVKTYGLLRDDYKRIVDYATNVTGMTVVIEPWQASASGGVGGPSWRGQLVGGD